MNIRSFTLMFIVVAIMVFSVYCYRTRNAYNVDHLEEVAKTQKYEIEVMAYAISLIPADIKNQVYLNSITEKFPEFLENEELIKMVGGISPKEEEEVKKEEEKKTINRLKSPSVTMNAIIDGFDSAN